MEGARQRKLPRTENGSSRRQVPTGSRATGANRTRFYLLTLLIVATLTFGLYCGLLPWERYVKHGSDVVDRMSVSLGLRKLVHSAVIDAGSTGSRVLAYTFIEGSDKSLRLYDELFVELKPGLSAFAGNPKESRTNIVGLLDRAKKVVPADALSRTPLVMKATAGLRLLPGDKADALLAESRKVLAESGFAVDDNAVTIMDGVDEGLFSWFTVNFLLDRLGGEVGATVAALDLGGGSTQIAFAPKDMNALKADDKKYLHRISAFHRTLDIYTHSYLGLGLNEARKSILQFNNTKHSFLLKSECINPIIKEHKWSYGGIGYIVTGPENPEYTIQEIDGEKFKTPIVRFQKCEETVQTILGSIDKPSELNSREIYAFSYYYDRAADSGLIDYDVGGVIQLKDFFKSARAKCEDPNVDQPFLCLDLTFISVLLRDGFGLAPSTKINLVKRIDDHEISWALGAAFHLLQNGS